MDGQPISENGHTITINTVLSSRLEAVQKKSYLDGRVVIEEVEGPGSGYEQLLHTENNTVFRVEIDVGLMEKNIGGQDFSINLISRNNEYAYSIQERYLKLLEDKEIRRFDLMMFLSPRLELLNPKVMGETSTSILTRSKLKHLLSWTKAEEKKLAKRLKGSTPESLSGDLHHRKAIKNRFYLVVNPFENTLPDDTVETKFLEFKEDDFCELKDGQLPELPGPAPHRLAIIVHGLASRIGEAYHDVALHLEKAGHHVFGFDYLTINQPISVSSQQLAKNINRLKKNYPESEVLIVAHSMGGLVARAAEVAHGAEIDQLIMAGTPNSGSLLVNNPNLVRSLFLFASILKVIPIKPEDYRQLIVSKDLLGLKDLSNKSGFISELNAKDRLHYSKKYFSLVGRYEGLSNDIIVHSENMTEINGTNIPSISLEKHHFEYFRGIGWYEPLYKALLYLE